MGLYTKYIFPKILDLSMANKSIGQERNHLLKEANANILEIGFGTGLNIPHYPNHVKHITVIDINSGMNHAAKKRLNASHMTVDYRILNAETLPFPDETFDNVVSTFTFCSIPNIYQALSEVQRVLKPGGKLLFLEHGLSPESTVAFWQNALNPLYKVFGCGCHLNRNIPEILESQRFSSVRTDQKYIKGAFKITGCIYTGTAQR